MKPYIHSLIMAQPNIFLLCLLPLAMAGITSFWDMTPIGPDLIHCLASTGYLEEAFVLAAFDQGSQQWQVAVDLDSLGETGAKTNLVLSLTNLQGRLPPQLEAHRIARQFESSRIDKFWISISNFMGSFRPSCGYLRAFTLFLRLYTHQ
jgi:hypothetical protein